MHELVRTNNAVLITAVEALLKSAGIAHVVLDQHMSVMEGSLGMLPRRIVVHEEDHESARQLLEDAGLAHELRLAPSARHETGDGTTDDAVLGGRLRLIQKRGGHRVGHDAMLLAAAAPVEPGDHAVDFGAGVGAAGLAVVARVPDVTVTLVEIDPVLAQLAAQNIARNGYGMRARAVTLDVLAAPDRFAANGLDAGSVDCVLMNPPFNDPARQKASPDAGRRAAHVAQSRLDAWLASAARLLRPDGRLALIWRADGLAAVLAALPPLFGAVSVLPIHGRAGRPAIRVVVRAAKDARAPLTVLPGLDLTDSDGRPTVAAEDILRRAQPLPE